MQGPEFLSSELARYEVFETEEALFQGLVQSPKDLIEFFSQACADTRWREEHEKLIKALLRWGAKSYYLGQLSAYDARQMAITIQTHDLFFQRFLYFRPALFLTMTLIIEQKPFLVNALLFGAASRFFYDLFKIGCFSKFHNEWTLNNISISSFELINTHVLKGKIEDLWRYSETEVFALMRQAKKWELIHLVQECAVILKRYINRDNIISSLLEAHRQLYIAWKLDCYIFFNQQNWSVRLLSGKDTDLKVEILDFKQETLELFEQLAPWVTHLAFRGTLSEEEFYYKTCIQHCPKLIGIDLGGTSAYTTQFDALPSHLVEIDLAACAWLKPEHLRSIGLLFPHLKRLKLPSNPQLNYMAWGELKHLHYLECLNVARCQQIADEDLKLIAQACPHLLEMNLEDCRGVTDQGISALIYYCQHLNLLTLNHCDSITDRTLLELGLRAYTLTQLNLEHCLNLSDQGLLSLVRLRHTLKVLNIKYCNFSLEVIKEVAHFSYLLQVVN